MRKHLFILSILMMTAAPAFASGEATPQASEAPEAKVPTGAVSFGSFTIETDEDSARDSLNRISGTYDLGFSSSDQSYESEHHQSVDPTKKDPSKTY